MDIDYDDSTDSEEDIRDIIRLQTALRADEPSTSCAVNKNSSSVTQTNTGSNSSCALQDTSRIEHALTLNKLYEEKLRRLEIILITRLRECREKLNVIQGLVFKNEKQETFRYVQCGRPYFKDKFNFPAPDNDDTIFMTNNNMYDFSMVSLVPGWTMKDKSEFVALLLKLSQDKRKKELNSRIAEIRREARKKIGTQHEERISQIKWQINVINKMGIKDLALPLDQEYDWDMISNKLSHRHSAHEYRALWKLFLHPSINKNCWSKEEHISLQNITHEKQFQDWDIIAKKLGTNRTGYQCFVYFRTNVSNTFTGQKWTREEEEYLKRLIEYYREDNYIPWNKIAATMEKRTKIQIYNKYLSLESKRKGKFIPEEDAVILNCVEKFGTNFKRMTKYLPGRTSIQIRCRYHILTKNRLSMVWSLEEDKKLIQLVANMDSATNYAALTQYFPGKDRVNIRARYLTLEKWMKCNPNKDISHAPRRGARRLGHGKAAANLNKAIEKLKHRIQFDVQKKKERKISNKSSEEVIEDGIIVTLVNESIKEDAPNRVNLNNDEGDDSEGDSEEENTSNISNLQKLLILLKAKLDKKRFESSMYFKKYPGLLSSEDNVCHVKFKSYSKQPALRQITVAESPDIWGKNLLQNSEYVLPPNYATITGLRKLMSYVSSVPKNGPNSIISINSLMRKNALLKRHIFVLMERFHLLFMWPMLLTNEAPITTETSKNVEMSCFISQNHDIDSLIENDDTEKSDDESYANK